MKIISTIALISINATLFVQMVSFLLFLFIINRVMFRPLRNVMFQRADHISHVKKDIDGTKIDLDALIVRMKEEEKAIREEARLKRSEIEALGEKEAEMIFSSAKEQIAAEKEKAHQKINDQIESAKMQIKSESEILSVSIIEKVLERRLAQ